MLGVSRANTTHGRRPSPRWTQRCSCSQPKSSRLIGAADGLRQPTDASRSARQRHPRRPQAGSAHDAKNRPRRRSEASFRCTIDSRQSPLTMFAASVQSNLAKSRLGRRDVHGNHRGGLAALRTNRGICKSSAAAFTLALNRARATNAAFYSASFECPLRREERSCLAHVICRAEFCRAPRGARRSRERP